MAPRLVDFQRNTAFAGFAAVVCFAASVFLARSLRDVIIPLIWSAFFALPIIGCINAVEGCLVAVFTHCRRLWRSSSRSEGARSPGDDEEIQVPFVAVTGQGHVTVRRDWKSEEMLRRVNRPLGIVCPCRRSKVSSITGCFRRRVRIVELSLAAPAAIDDVEEGEEDEDNENGETSELGQEVNRLVVDWYYYTKASPDDGDITVTTGGSLGAAESSRTLDLQLFLDVHEAFPAVVEDGSLRPRQLKGRLQVERPSAVSWTLAVVIVTALILFAIGIGAWLLGIGIEALVDNIDGYQKGLSGIADWVIDALKKMLPPSMIQALRDKFSDLLTDAIPTLVQLVVANLEVVMWDGLLFLIYLGFWISEPLPLDPEVTRVFRTYLFLKTLVCILFGCMMGMLLWWLQCPLWSLFWVLTFLLNYIPEVGAVLSALLSVPAVLFDGSVDLHTRCWRTMWLAIWGTLFKVFTGNIIEVHVYSTKGGQFMRMHPVILMAAMMFSYCIMGISGMFLAVPLVATIKFYIVAARMPQKFSHPLLKLIEGDNAGPHKNFVDSRRSRQPETPRQQRLPALCTSGTTMSMSQVVTDNSESLQLSLLDNA